MLQTFRLSETKAPVDIDTGVLGGNLKADNIGGKENPIIYLNFHTMD